MMVEGCGGDGFGEGKGDREEERTTCSRQICNIKGSMETGS